jgi:type IV secretory pathway VirB10-like protein
MSIRLTGAADPTERRRTLLITGGCGIVGLAIGGVMLWGLLGGVEPAAADHLSAGGRKLLERSQARRTEQASEAARLRQREIGDEYQMDKEGNLLGPPADSPDLPANRLLGNAESLAAPGPRAEIGAGIEHAPPASREESATRAMAPAREEGTEDRAAGAQSMLGYSTVRGATWALRRPEAGGDERATVQRVAAKDDDDRLVSALERSIAAGSVSPREGGPEGGPRASGPGPAGAGERLYPAERATQTVRPGAAGDMRIGGGVGADEIVRQGKFLDCVLVNELRVDLVESPVVAMVSRDFVGLDGKAVLIPAGAKLLGSAGQVGNLQQARVYVRFDRVVFPDQRSAYFPSREVQAVDGVGAAGIPGDVDRHLFLQFGAATMLGVLDGLAAAVEAPNTGASPGVRELVAARTSSNFSAVVAGVLGRYANVVPTVTVEPGAKLKVFFAEDVWLSPYMRTADLSFVRRGAR